MAWGQARLHNKFWTSLGYRARLSKNKTNKQTKPTYLQREKWKQEACPLSFRYGGHNKMMFVFVHLCAGPWEAGKIVHDYLPPYREVLQRWASPQSPGHGCLTGSHLALCVAGSKWNGTWWGWGSHTQANLTSSAVCVPMIRLCGRLAASAGVFVCLFKNYFINVWDYTWFEFSIPKWLER